MLLSAVTSPAVDSAVLDMAWKSMQMRRPHIALPTKALPSIDLRRNFNTFSPKECVYVDKYASMCGSLVVLRPETAVRAESAGKTTPKVDASNIANDLKEKIDAIEDKPQAALYAGGAVVALVVANSLVTSVESLPLLPGLLETVGLGYSGWFVYRYLLKEESRKELFSDIEEIKK